MWTCRGGMHWCGASVFLLSAMLALLGTPVRAATSHVTNCGSSGPGSLPFFITTAASGDTIVFDVDCPSKNPITPINAISINKSLTIDGSGHSVSVNGSQSTVSFNIGGFSGGFTVTLTALTIEKGQRGILNYASNVTVMNCTVRGNNAFSTGGGIYNNGGVMAVTNSTISGNTLVEGFAGSGGGITNGSNGVMTLTNSTVAGNQAIFRNGVGPGPAKGGGVYNEAGSTLILVNSTISGNRADAGGGVYNNAGTVVTTDTIIAANNAPTYPDIAGTFDSGGHNLIGNTMGGNGMPGTGDLLNVNPKLGPLLNNGGPTQTMAITNTSPAYDAGGGTCPSGITTDQRGFPRPQGPACDIGAYEALVGPAPTIAGISSSAGPTAGGSPITITGTNFLAGATVSLGGANAINVTVVNGATITTTTPVHAVGTVGVTVSNPDGGAMTVPGIYTFGVLNPVPVPKPSIVPGSVPGSLPVPQPSGAAGSAPNPLPLSRP